METQAMMRQIALTLMLVLLAACASKDNALYQWDAYQDQVYEGFQIESGNTSPDKQLQKLEEEMQKAAAKGKALPPGYQAHMGYLYFQTGQLNKAAAAFEAEKKQFPESTVYMNLVLAKLKQP